MFHIILQVWGGIFYLLAKIFFSQSERSKTKRKTWRIWTWIVYIIGLPAWVIIFVLERNWIAAALESGNIPSMTLGLVIAIKGKGKQPKWLDYIAITAVVIGLCYSIYDFNGLTAFTQYLELGIVAGFLIGTYMLAKENAKGYLWFLLMCGSNTILMAVESYPWLMVQQIISLGFIGDAYLVNKRNIAKRFYKSKAAIE